MTAAHYIPKCAVGLLPMPRLTQFCRQGAPGSFWMEVEQLANEGNVLRRNEPSSVAPLRRSVAEPKPERKTKNVVVLLLLRANTPPDRGSYNIWVSCGQQQLCLVGLKYLTVL